MSLGASRSKANSRPGLAVTHHSIVTWEKGHLRASVVELSEGGAQLMGVSAAPIHGISRTSHPDLDRWVAGCDRALTQAEDGTLVSCGRKLVPDRVTMSVPAEITRSLPIVLTQHRRDPNAPCTLDEFRQHLQRGYRKAQDVLGTAKRDATDDIIYGSLAEVRLDGQPMVDPLGLHGSDLELRLNFTLAPVEWLRALEIVAERLQVALTGIIPHTAAYAAPLADPAALVLLLDEHHTSVNMVRRGRLEWSSLVEIGEREMTSATAEALGLRGRQADALMRAYRARQLQENVELQLAWVFWRELKGWMTAIAEAVQGSARDGVTLPNHVYFFDVTRRIPEALQALETPQFEASLPFGRCPELQELSASLVHDVLDCTAETSGPAYLALRSLASYVASLYSPAGILDRALVETIRWRKSTH